MAALEGARPVQQEIEKIKLAERLLGWRLTFLGWMAIGAGGKMGGFLDRPGGIGKSLLLMAAWPVAQWGFRQVIKQKQKQLPSIGPEGEVLYGRGPDEGKDSPGRRE